MLAKNHIVFGASCYTALAMVDPHIPVNAVALVVVMLSSLLPDIDHPGSWLGRRLKIISVPLSNIIGHRGFTHSLLAVFLIVYCLLSYFYNLNYILLAIFIGYLSHILADFLTKSGVPLLWPAKNRFFMPILAFRTGSYVEYLVTAAFALLVFWAFWNSGQSFTFI